MMSKVRLERLGGPCDLYRIYCTARERLFRRLRSDPLPGGVQEATVDEFV